jgi:hypothetical protein
VKEGWSRSWPILRPRREVLYQAFCLEGVVEERQRAEEVPARCGSAEEEEGWASLGGWVWIGLSDWRLE